MGADNAIGLFGKLPSHGDFIQRNIATATLEVWDEWLQRLVSVSQEHLGDSWLDIYLTSPVWRFALTPGALDEHTWVGVLVPSVDRVGRYFPFSLLMPLAAADNPMQVMLDNNEWYSALEDVALAALNGEMDADDVMAALPGAPATINRAYAPGDTEAASGLALHIDLAEDQNVAVGYAYWLDMLLRERLASYSLWNTQGSELVAPCLAASPNLPGAAEVTALLDGNWRHWQWCQPHVFQSYS